MNSSRKFCVQFMPPISQLSVVTYLRVLPRYGLAALSSGVSSLSQYMSSVAGDSVSSESPCQAPLPGERRMPELV